ncbi:MAG: hypothetical protein V8S14_03495 [Lachnospiraceae bacterium]
MQRPTENNIISSKETTGGWKHIPVAEMKKEWELCEEVLEHMKSWDD